MADESSRPSRELLSHMQKLKHGPVDVLLGVGELDQLLLEDLGVIVKLNGVADHECPPGNSGHATRSDVPPGTRGQFGVGAGKRFESHCVLINAEMSHNVIRKGRR